MARNSTYIGFFLDNETINKLKIISHMTKKDRSVLIREGLEHMMEKHKDSFDKFSLMIEAMKK